VACGTTIQPTPGRAALKLLLDGYLVPEQLPGVPRWATRRCRAESAANDPPASSAAIRVAAADMDLEAPEQQDDRQLTLLRLAASQLRVQAPRCCSRGQAAAPRIGRRQHGAGGRECQLLIHTFGSTQQRGTPQQPRPGGTLGIGHQNGQPNWGPDRGMPHPPSIKKASDLCGFTPTQHLQFTLLHLSFCVKAPNVVS